MPSAINDDFERLVEEHMEYIHLTEYDILHTLSDLELAVWVPWAIGGLSVEEIALKVERDVNVVSQVLSRARGKLRKTVLERPRQLDISEEQ